ncbi:drug/metabolite transporter superfamily protein YnfA [Streptosporangium lutulentum]|uniref:Drug/metabolite transporter superfamily protein YnfA n=1 Tax=Streptosporangium lutulentum TaxID=1461250 RepID=A0ABT9QA65_9ACTN|nr:drug/metabolite transporter superfamily protein YnfA [Streptosporangium lutulentum]
MTIVRSLVLFALAALAEIGGAWLIWQGIREQRSLAWVGAGEAVEIVNIGSTAISIAGWTVRDGTAVRHTFAAGTRLPGC